MEAQMRHADPGLTEGTYFDAELLPIQGELKRVRPVSGGIASDVVSNLGERRSVRRSGSAGLNRTLPDRNADDTLLVTGWTGTLKELQELVDLCLLGYQMQKPGVI
jgi:hypothetical protein